MTGSSRALSRRSFAVRAFASLATFDLASSAHGQAPASAGKSVPPEVERANVAVVNEFCAAFARKDLAKAVLFLADNCTYRTSQTRPPLVGKETVSETIKGFIERGAEFKVLKSIALGPVVLNERDDIVVPAGGGPARTFHIAAGFFFLENGKIAEWTDYVLR